MQKDKIQNLLISLYTTEIVMALARWQKNYDKSFLSQWHDHFNIDSFTHIFDSETKEEVIKDKSSSRQILKEYLHHVSNSLIVQSFVYAYDNMKWNLKDFDGNAKKELEFIKSIISDQEIEDSRLVNFMRNDIAHNDDVDSPIFTYDYSNEVLHFGSKDNSRNVDIPINLLIRLMRLYNDHIEELRSAKYAVLIQTDKLREKKKCSSGDIFQLVNTDSGEKIFPDEHQQHALDQITDRIKQGVFIPHKMSAEFYPHKDSSINNLCNLTKTSIMLDNLYLRRADDSRCFGEYIFGKYGKSFGDMNSIKDMIFPILSNLLFQIFSANPNSFLQKCTDDAGININIQKVRNAVMHGTFFYDRDNSLVFYDDVQKLEESLKYEGTLRLEDIFNFFEQFKKNKFPNAEGTFYTIGSEDINYPHVVDFDQERLK